MVVELTLGGETIETTPEHPFYVLLRGWVDASELRPGMAVRQVDGDYELVETVELVQRTQRMYNLTVAEAHTFFVGDDAWLVHNANADQCTLLLPQGLLINGQAPQQYAASLAASAGRHARGAAGERALRALYPGGRALTLKTQWGDRDLDWTIIHNGVLYGFESKNVTKPVPASTHALQEALKDWELIQTEAAVGRRYVPIWVFWDAGPTPALQHTLRQFGIQTNIYNKR